MRKTLTLSDERADRGGTDDDRGIARLATLAHSGYNAARNAYCLAVERERTANDALFLALSVREHCRLATVDERLVDAAGADLGNGGRLARW